MCKVLSGILRILYFVVAVNIAFIINAAQNNNNQQNNNVQLIIEQIYNNAVANIASIDISVYIQDPVELREKYKQYFDTRNELIKCLQDMKSANNNVIDEDIMCKFVRLMIMKLLGRSPNENIDEILRIVRGKICEMADKYIMPNGVVMPNGDYTDVDCYEVESKAENIARNIILLSEHQDVLRLNRKLNVNNRQPSADILKENIVTLYKLNYFNSRFGYQERVQRITKRASKNINNNNKGDIAPINKGIKIFEEISFGILKYFNFSNNYGVGHELHHIVPMNSGGITHVNNLVVLPKVEHGIAHAMKSNRDLFVIDWHESVHKCIEEDIKEYNINKDLLATINESATKAMHNVMSTIYLQKNQDSNIRDAVWLVRSVLKRASVEEFIEYNFQRIDESIIDANTKDTLFTLQKICQNINIIVCIKNGSIKIETSVNAKRGTPKYNQEINKAREWLIQHHMEVIQTLYNRLKKKHNQTK